MKTQNKNKKLTKTELITNVLLSFEGRDPHPDYPHIDIGCCTIPIGVMTPTSGKLQLVLTLGGHDPPLGLLEL